MSEFFELEIAPVLPAWIWDDANHPGYGSVYNTYAEAVAMASFFEDLDKEEGTCFILFPGAQRNGLRVSERDKYSVVSKSEIRRATLEAILQEEEFDADGWRNFVTEEDSGVMPGFILQ